MEYKKILPMILLCAWLIFPLSAAWAQGSSSIMEKVMQLDDKIKKLEATQKRDIDNLKKGQSGVGGEDLLALQDTLKVLQQEMEGMKAELKSVKADSSMTSAAQMLNSLSNDLKALMTEFRQSMQKEPAAPTPEIKAATPETKTLQAEVMTSRFKVKFYGFVRFETFYDNAEFYKGDWLLYVPSGNNSMKGLNIFSMNARHTRLGVNIDGMDLGTKGKTKGNIEFDFAGGFPNSSTAARQPLLRLRSAWVDIVYPKWEARFGQDWALISTPFPNSTSFVVGAGLGNLWQNYPQFKFTWKPDPVKVSISINRPMAGNTKYNEFNEGDLDVVEDGERSGMPWFMARSWLKVGAATLSVSGHYGQEAIPDLKARVHHMDSYSANMDVILSVNPVTFTARGFYGKNLNSFFGGAIQGFSKPDSFTIKNVTSQGGWAQVVCNVTQSWSATLGGGIDDPVDGDLTNGMRTQNGWGFGNVVYDFKKTLTFMLEGEYIKTLYKNANAGEGTRIEFVTYYKF